MKQIITCICVLTPLEIFAKAKKKVIGVLFLTGLTFSASCVLDVSTEPSGKSLHKSDALTIFVTGNELGALKPCGCSGGQLGGLDRRAAVFNRVPKNQRLIIDTGSLVKSQDEQDLIKFNIIIEAFRQLDYNLVNLTEKDIEIAQYLGLLSNPIVGFISPYGTGEKITGRFRNQYLLKGKYITISVLTFNVETSPIKQIREVFPREPGQQSVNILIINRCDDAIVSSIAEMGIVDCIICPSESDEPMVLSRTNTRPLVFSVGRFGRYVCGLQITEAARGKGRPKLSFRAIPIKENLKPQASLVRLYQNYQQIVRQWNLLEKYPRFILPDGLKYSGSESCKACHEYEYGKWSRNAHARAYATLERAGTQFDPECAVCHVVGMEYESGFISEQKTSHLKNVGCENCHGAGSEHITTLGQSGLVKPKSACIDCHTPEHSGRYVGNERSFLQKIVHWREPKANSNVK